MFKKLFCKHDYSKNIMYVETNLATNYQYCFRIYSVCSKCYHAKKILSSGYGFACRDEAIREANIIIERIKKKNNLSS
jgi:hypothetical protein